MVAFGTETTKELLMQAIINVVAEEHGLEPITLIIDGRLGKTLGRAYYHNRTIKINPMIMHNAAVLEDTLRHEVAHFLAWDKYGGRGHGDVWKMCAIQCGAKPLQYEPFKPDDLRASSVRYIYDCEKGCKHFANRISKRWERGYCLAHNLKYYRRSV